MFKPYNLFSMQLRQKKLKSSYYYWELFWQLLWKVLVNQHLTNGLFVFLMQDVRMGRGLTFCPSNREARGEVSCWKGLKLSNSNTSSHRRHLLWAGPVNPFHSVRVGRPTVNSLYPTHVDLYQCILLTKFRFELYCRFVTINFIIS